MNQRNEDNRTMTAITKNRITFTVTVEYVVNPDNAEITGG